MVNLRSKYTHPISGVGPLIVLATIIFSSLISVASAQSTSGLYPDPVEGVLSAFEERPIVMFGDAHGSRKRHDFLMHVIRDRRFP